MGITFPLEVCYAGVFESEDLRLPENKTPASFLTGVLKERPARSGMVASPEQYCAGLSMLRVADSRTWHARSFLKISCSKLMSCDSA
jgi:hypothetical protein